MSRGGVPLQARRALGVADEKVGVLIENLLSSCRRTCTYGGYRIVSSRFFLPAAQPTIGHAPSLYLVRNAGPPKQNKSALTLSAAAARP
jgi:hypothetical protein